MKIKFKIFTPIFFGLALSAMAQAGLEYDEEKGKLYESAVSPTQITNTMEALCGVKKVTLKYGFEHDGQNHNGKLRIYHYELTSVVVTDIRNSFDYGDDYTKDIKSQLIQELNTDTAISIRCSHDVDFFMINLDFPKSSKGRSRSQNFQIYPDGSVEFFTAF